MLYYNRIDISERIDLAKSNNSKKCMISHYWFFNHGFKFEDSVCNGCCVFHFFVLVDIKWLIVWTSTSL